MSKKDNVKQFWDKNRIVESDRSSEYNTSSPKRLLADDIETLMDMMDNINDGGRVRWIELLTTMREFCGPRCTASNKMFRERYGITCEKAYARRIRKKEKEDED